MLHSRGSRLRIMMQQAVARNMPMELSGLAMPELVRMHAHGVGKSCPAAGKVVLSHLGPGESWVKSEVPALKIVLEGEEIHEIDGRPYRISPAEMLLVEPGADYTATVRRTGSTRGLCIYLPVSMARPQREDTGRAILTTQNSPLGRKLRLHAQRLLDGVPDAEGEAQAIIDTAVAGYPSLVSEAGEMLHRIGAQRQTTRRHLRTRLEYARAHLDLVCDRPVPLEELARIAGMSAFHLARYFADAYGAPPASYHRARRLREAARLLQRGDRSVAEIANAVGYAEPSSFTHAFHREYGVSPSAAKPLLQAVLASGQI